MIISKIAGSTTDRNGLNYGALRRKDMRRGRQVVVVDMERDLVAEATIMSSPFDDGPKSPDRETGANVLVRFEAAAHTITASLYELGVEPDETDGWSGKYLLDANRYSNQQKQARGAEDDLD